MKHILIIDDDIHINHMLDRVLTQTGSNLAGLNAARTIGRRGAASDRRHPSNHHECQG